MIDLDLCVLMLHCRLLVCASVGGHICQGACAEIEDNSLELDRSYSVGLGAPIVQVLGLLQCGSWVSN